MADATNQGGNAPAATKADATTAGLGGKTQSSKAAAKTAKPKASAKRQVTKRGDQAPESGSTAKERSAKAEKMFKDADQAALVGLPADMTHEQNENRLRRAALGY